MRISLLKTIATLALLALLSAGAGAKVKLPAIWADGMVIQRGQEIIVRGTADAGEEIRVSFGKKTYTAVAGADGGWTVSLPPMNAGGPYTLTVNDISLRDVLVGDVWLCAGQSNMETPLSRIADRYADEILSYTNTQIRHVKLPMDYNLHDPQADTKPAPWTPATPGHIATLTGVPYYFARFLYEEIHIPIGLVNASVGGSPAEAWVSKEGLKAFPHYLNLKNLYASDAYAQRLQELQRLGASRWMEVLNAGDPGLREGWHDPAYDDSDWPLTGLFDDWGRDANGLAVNGSFWFRRTVDVAPLLAGQEAMLRLGCVVDADSVYVNGVFVGATGYQYPPRKYAIPAGLLRAGENVVGIRLISQAGPPHFVSEKPYKIVFAGGEEISLDEMWRYHPGNRMPAMPGGVSFQFTPTALYNAMIAPLAQMRFRGVVWYQAEANVSRAAEYASLFPALVADWRRLWQRPDLPFLFVQLPEFLPNYPGASQWAAMRNVQRKLSHTIPHSGMAVALGTGEWNDVHPLNKRDVGYRLMLQAMRLAYGDAGRVADGPVYESHRVEENKIILTFRPGTDDIPPGGPLGGFEIAGADGIFHAATAYAENGKVTVWNEQVTRPAVVRYAWANSPYGADLCNRAGLPASPFQTE